MIKILDKISTFSWDIFPYIMIIMTIILSTHGLILIIETFGYPNLITIFLAAILIPVTIIVIYFFQVMHNVFRGKVP